MSALRGHSLAGPGSALARAPGDPLAWACGLLLAGWALTFLWDPWGDERVNDTGLYRELAKQMFDGEVPFRDFAFEYPPLTAPILAAPRLLAEGYRYRVALAGGLFVFAVGALLLLRYLARRTGGSDLVAMLVFAASPFYVGALVRNHYDLIPAVIALAALAAIVARRPRLGFVLIGVGAMTKVFPLAIAPIAFAWLWRQGERREAWRSVAALAATIALIAGAWFALSPGGAIDSVNYHRERPVQVESLPAVVVYAADGLGGERPVPVDSHRSQGIKHPLDGTAAAVSALAGIGAMALLVLGAGGWPPRLRSEPRAQVEEARVLVLASLAAIACLAVFTKVLSPQYIVWTLPFLALAAAWRLWPLSAALAGATVLTFVEFPSHYWDVVYMEPAWLWVLGARDLLLVAAVAIAIATLLRQPAGGSARSNAPARPRPTRPAPR